MRPEAEQAFDRAQQAHWEQTANVRRYDHPVVRLFARQRVARLARMLGPWRPERALDVGCGDGFGMAHMCRLADAIHGCDRSAAMLAANPAPSSSLTCCDAYRLPFGDGQFDLVYCWELLHHVGDPLRVVREMARVSSRAVLLCEPNRRNPAMALFGLLNRAERGLLRFTPSGLRRLLKAAGLDQVQGRAVGWFTPNRTPERLSRLLVRLPYDVPLVGLYGLALGYKLEPPASGRLPSAVEPC